MAEFYLNDNYVLDAENKFTIKRPKKGKSTLKMNSRNSKNSSILKLSKK